MAKISTKRKGRAGAEVLPPRRVARLDLTFLQALVLAGRSFEYIERVLENSDLPPTSSEELASIREALGPPKNLKPNAASHKPSVAYLDRVGLSEYFRNSPKWREAKAILESPKARELTEAAILAWAPDAQIIALLRMQAHGTSLGGLRVYERFFFNVNSVSRSELRVLVGARVRQCILRVLGADAHEDAMKEAIEADGRTVAASLPAAVLRWPSVQLSLGCAVPNLKLAPALDDVVNLAAIRSASMVLRGRPGDEQIAERYSSVLERLQRVRETLSEPDEDLYRKLRKIQIRHETSSVVTVAELRAGGGQVSTASHIPPNGTVLDAERAERDGEQDDDGDDGVDLDPSAADVG